MTGTYTLFDTATYQQRIADARAVLEANNLDACIMVAPEHQFYFAGFDSWTGVNSPQALVFTRHDDQPTLVLRNVDLSLALESTCISDIRTYHLHSENFADIICEILKQKGVASGRIAIEMQSYALPFSLGREIAAAIAPAELVDATTTPGQSAPVQIHRRNGPDRKSRRICKPRP